MPTAPSPPPTVVAPAKAPHALAGPALHAEGAAGPIHAPAPLMLPARLLDPDETIVLLLRPSPLFIVLMPLRSLAVIALAVLLTGQMQARGLGLGLSNADLVLAGLGLIGARLFWQVLEWLNQIYVLTDRRVVRVGGVVNVRVFERPIGEVRRADLLRPLFLRVFGLGTIGFVTVSDRFHEAHWLMVADPQQTHQTVVQSLRRYRD